MSSNPEPTAADMACAEEIIDAIGRSIGIYPTADIADIIARHRAEREAVLRADAERAIARERRYIAALEEMKKQVRAAIGVKEGDDVVEAVERLRSERDELKRFADAVVAIVENKEGVIHSGVKPVMLGKLVAGHRLYVSHAESADVGRGGEQ